MSRPGIESFRYASSPGTPGAGQRRSSQPGGPPPPPPLSVPPQLIDNAGETFQTVADFILGLPHPRHWPGLLATYFLLDPIRALAANVIALITSPRTHRVVLRLSILTGLFWTAVILAVFAYIGFYRAWVPEVGRMEELFLQYGNQGQVPYAEVDLSRWRGLGKAMAVGEDWFAEEQEYEAAVELLVPISTSNLDLGNFMVSMDLVTADNITVFRSSRPAILRPTTPTSRFLSQFAQQLSNRPSVAGTQMLPIPFTSPSLELMTITLFDRVVLHPSPGSVPFSDPQGSPLQAGGRPRRITKAIVRVGRHDADRYWTYGGGHGVGGVVMAPHTSQGAGASEAGGMVLATQSGGAFRSRGELQTVSAGLRFDAKLTGLRYILYTHPVLSFVVFTSLFLAFELVSALTLWTIAAVYTSTLPGLEVDLGADTQFVPRPGGSGGGGGGGGGGSRRLRRPSYPPSTTTATGDDSVGDEEETETETEGRNGDDSGDARARARSMASLLARDEAEQREARLAAEEQARRSGRLMTGDDAAGGSPDDLLTPTYGRRVLGRLDEETEEETDGASTATTLSREDAAEQRRMRQATVATASQSTASSQETLSGSEGSRQADDEGDETAVIGTAGRREGAAGAQPEGFRRRKAYEDEGGDDGGRGGSAPSLLGGSATDPSVAGSSSRRSFGATTEASRRTETTAATRGQHGEEESETSAEEQSSS